MKKPMVLIPTWLSGLALDFLCFFIFGVAWFLCTNIWTCGQIRVEIISHEPQFFYFHACCSEWVLGNREDLVKDILSELQPENGEVGHLLLPATAQNLICDFPENYAWFRNGGRTCAWGPPTRIRTGIWGCVGPSTAPSCGEYGRKAAPGSCTGAPTATRRRRSPAPRYWKLLMCECF